MHTYRHEIDGMRALAVSSVILFHAGFTCCPGGYVGVDVFFVISGYLITSTILTDHEQGNFSLLRFYERRARRILPALFVVLFSCLPFAYHYMLLDKLKTFAQGLISITLCSSNVFFWMKEDYFNSNTELNPLVHTWSLAIEEQFYIVYSLLFVLFSNKQHRLIIIILVTVSMISLILVQWSGNLHMTPPFIARECAWFSQRDWASFYLLTGRMWELLFGALAAFYLARFELQHSLRNEVGALVGLFLILFATFRFNKNTAFPSLNTLIPTIGAVLLIIYGDRNTCIGRLLSTRATATVGLCSYSAYLWHQPLLAFAKLSVFENNLSVSVRIGLIVLTLALAFMCWHFVEKPFRKKEKFSRRQVFVYALSAGLIIDLIAIAALVSPGSAIKWIDLGNTSSGQARLLNNDYLGEISESVAKHYQRTRFHAIKYPPSYTNNSKRNRLAIIGDSHAEDFVNMVAENNKLENYEIRTYYVHNSCQMYIGNEDRFRFISTLDQVLCRKYPELQNAMPLIEASDVIILVSSWKLWAAERINSTIQQLNLRKNQTIVVVGGKGFSRTNPALHLDTPYNYRMNLRSNISFNKVKINSVLMNILGPTVVVDVIRLICDHNHLCPVFTPDERLISFDGSHLTKSGAKFIGSIIFEEPPLSVL